MAPIPPTLHMLCGKAASGKSTLAAHLGQIPNTVVIAEDDWLAVLFAGEFDRFADYARCMKKLRAVMGPHIASVLKAGTSVVLDFQANTVASRIWLRQIAQDGGAAHQLHVLDVSDAVCLARLAARNASGAHPFELSTEQFHQLAKHFVMPTAEEGLQIVMHSDI